MRPNLSRGAGVGARRAEEGRGRALRRQPGDDRRQRQPPRPQHRRAARLSWGVGTCHY